MISDYKKKNFSNPAIEASKQKEQDKNNENDLPCIYCGYFGHGTTPKTHIRQTRCPAFGKACSRCGELGHFGKVCRQKKESSNKESVEAQAIFGVDNSSDDDNVEIYAMQSLLESKDPNPRKTLCTLLTKEELVCSTFRLTNLENGPIPALSRDT